MSTATWVDDFNSFQSSQDTFGDEIPKEKGIKKPQTKKEVLENELKLLEWHKMANEAALKSALLQTKAMKDTDETDPPSQLVDDAKWIKKVVEEEQIKPLEVTKDFVLEYDKNQTAMRESKGRQLDSKIQTMDKLRKSLEKKVDLKARTQEYRQWKRDFISKKEAVMMGKTLDDMNPSEPQTTSKPGSRNEGDMNGLSMSRQQSRGSQELATVLDSLNKLADLEQRISTLEANNQFETLKGKEGKGGNKTNGGSTNGLNFQKKRSKAANTGRTQLVYGVKEPTKRLGGGTFLTGGNDDDMYEDPREAAKRDRLRAQSQASQGQKNLRSRIQDKKAKQRDVAAGNKRHEAAMKELAKRRQDQAAKVRAAKGQPRAARPSIGMASGVRTKNRHLAEFQNIKSNFTKRKDDLTRKMRSNVGAPSVAQRNNNRRGMGGVTGARKGGVARAPVGTRVASMSAPSKKSVPAVGAGVNAVRGRSVRSGASTTGRTGGIATQRGGTMTTRRTQNSAPNRRVGGAEIPLAPGTIAVTGIGGIKQLRNNNNNNNNNYAKSSISRNVSSRKR